MAPCTIPCTSSPNTPTLLGRGPCVGLRPVFFLNDDGQLCHQLCHHSALCTALPALPAQLCQLTKAAPVAFTLVVSITLTSNTLREAARRRPRVVGQVPLRSCARRRPPATASTAKCRCACVRGGGHSTNGQVPPREAARRWPLVGSQVPLRLCARRWPQRRRPGAAALPSFAGRHVSRWPSASRSPRTATSSGATRRAALPRPAASLLRRAARLRLVCVLSATIHFFSEDGHFVGRCVALPVCVSSVTIFFSEDGKLPVCVLRPIAGHHVLLLRGRPLHSRNPTQFGRIRKVVFIVPTDDSLPFDPTGFVSRGGKPIRSIFCGSTKFGRVR